MALTSIIAAIAASVPLAMASQFVMYTPGGDDTTVQRIDPVINPGSIASHVHQVFGANALSDTLTYEALQQSSCTTVADAKGRGNAFDNSVYWHPALYAQKKDGTGYLRIPTSGHKLYYRDAGSKKDTKREPFEFPHGFRMIAGDPRMRGADADRHRQNITQWICHDPAGWNQGTDGGFPKGVNDCKDYPGFNGAIHFPHCWNGNDYDQANPTAHVVYPTGDIENGACPSSHPTRLPHIFIENQFDLHKVVNQVKPDTFVLAQGDDTGYGWHADFFNGWVDGAIPSLLASCPYAFYGNEDVGQCSFFKGRSTAAKDCKLPTKYTEEVTNPGKFLPGCNPISHDNPAPKYAVAPLNVFTDVCNALGSLPAATVPAITLPSVVPDSNPVNLPPVDSITKALPTTIFAEPTPFAVPSTFATFFTNTVPPQLPFPYTPAPVANSPATAVNSPPPAASPSFTCPASDGTKYTTKDATFQIECNTDHYGDDIKMKKAKCISECMDICAGTKGCVAVSLSGQNCYLKKGLGKQTKSNKCIGAKLVSGGSTTASAPATTQPPVYQQSHGEGMKTEYKVFTAYEYVTVTAQPDPVHRRHADFHT